ncbi:Uncharacterized protein HZ326_13574 [Fusarium oxysporum f. sp. albedinis]|nr:Uncharacterized protein HZ326_13574 [Fusarium oxysporum f. sp. albedinis]
MLKRAIFVCKLPKPDSEDRLYRVFIHNIFFWSRIDRSASSQLTRLLVRVVGSHRIDSTRQNSSPNH